MLYRGIIHVHSSFSYDSFMKPSTIVNIAEKNNLNFIIVTDHDTIAGAVEVQRIVKKRGLNIEVPLAAEYKTSYGDVIAAFIDYELKNMDFDTFCNEVRRQNGIILLPHPFKGHQNIEYLVEKSDLIETFNSRASRQANEKALEIAVRKQKPYYAASDAHLSNELLNTVLKLNSEYDLKNALLNSEIYCEVNNSSNPYNIICSQCIKAIKKRDIKLLGAQTKSFMSYLYNRDLLKPF
ncbi:MAG: PHP domain-containing protein [Syntrophomonadaceae bacterium]|nr:PHP domain-containing protein [Syntrophomonadaceae bacterium]